MARHHRKKQKWLYSGLALVALVLITVGISFGMNSGFGDKGEGVPQDIENDENLPEDLSTEARSKIEQMDEYEDPESVEYEPTITGTITSQEIKNGKFLLRIAIEQLIDSEGACKISVYSNGVERYNDITMMDANSTYYSCGFDVPLNDFQKGSYLFRVNLETDSQKGDLNGEFVYE